MSHCTFTVSTYHQHAARRSVRNARAGLIPPGYLMVRDLPGWCAQQLGDNYDHVDALNLARVLRDKAIAMVWSYQGQPAYLVSTSRIPDPITELLP